MDNKDKSIEKYDNSFIKRVLKSLLCTFFICVISIWGIFLLFSLAYGEASADTTNALGIISFCIGIIFTIFYCTFTIIGEIRNKN